MIEIQWKSSTATSISKILPRLPILVNDPGPTFAVCQNLILLRQNLNLEFDGFDETLTFRWEQVGGSLVDIDNPTSFDATIDLIAQPPDDRFFRLIVNEGRLNEVQVIVPVFSRIVSSTGPGLGRVVNNVNPGIYTGSVSTNLAIFTPRNETFSACSVVGTEYLDVTTTVSAPSSIVFISLQVWNASTKQWQDEQVGSPELSFNRFVVLQGVSYRIRILWKRSPHSPTVYEYTSEVIKYTGQFEGFPAFSSKGGNLAIYSPDNELFWDIDRIRRSRVVLDEPEQTEDPVGGFDIKFPNVASGISLDRIQRFRIILDEPEQTEDPVGGFAILGVTNYQTFNIERVSGINISV